MIQNKYDFKSKDIFYSKNEKFINSKKLSIKDDNGNIYELENFFYNIDKKTLKGQNVSVYSKIDDNKIDKYFFDEGFFNF